MVIFNYQNVLFSDTKLRNILYITIIYIKDPKTLNAKMYLCQGIFKLSQSRIKRSFTFNKFKVQSNNYLHCTVR